MDRRLLYIAIGIITVGAIYTWQFIPVEGDYKGSILIAVTLNFTDGTSKTYSPLDNPGSAYGFIPLYVWDPSTANEVTKISYTVQVKTNWDGTLSSFSFSGTSHEMVLRDITGLSSSSSTNPPSTLPKDEWFTIASGSVAASSIDTACSAVLDREQEIYIDITADVTLAISDDNGNSDSKSATGSVTVKLGWDPEAPPDPTDPAPPALSITALSVNISPTKTLS